MKKILFLMMVAVLTLTSVLRAENLNSFSLLSSQKENYKNNDWPRFFGHALFYRIQNEQQKIDFNSTFFSLEALALLRHCQFEKAEAVLKKAQAMNHQTEDTTLKNKNEEEFKKIEYVLELAKSSKKDYSKANTEAEVNKVQQKWKTSQKQIALLTTPEQLRVSVQNLCESTKKL